MDFLFALLPELELWGKWIYWVLLLVMTLESAAFVGLVVPGTTVVVFSGFLAAQHVMDLGDVIWIVALGGIIGDAISFYAGRRGISLVTPTSRIFKQVYVDRGVAFFKKYGNKSVLLARFVGPIRPIVPFVAGLCRMSAKKFFFYNITSGFAAAVVYVGIGYFFGQAWGKVEPWIAHVKVAAFIAFIAAFVGYLLRRQLFRNNKK